MGNNHVLYASLLEAIVAGLSPGDFTTQHMEGCFTRLDLAKKEVSGFEQWRKEYEARKYPLSGVSKRLEIRAVYKTVKRAGAISGYWIQLHVVYLPIALPTPVDSWKILE